MLKEFLETKRYPLDTHSMKTRYLFLTATLVVTPILLAEHHQEAESKEEMPVTEGEATPLFDGKTLKGWVQKNGTATYKVEDGTIVGTTAKGSPNSFLTTAENYGDFDMEFEVKVDNALNSGIMIRSQTEGGTHDGRVNGPQVEIEASGANGAEAGYLYGEAIGGWMTPEKDLKPHKTFKDGEWNKMRILARGPRIQTWINGEQISDLTDEKVFKSHPTGFIGLQVHGVGDKGPFQVAWRKLSIKDLGDKK